MSSTLGHADWYNSTVLSGDVVSEVAALKQRLPGEIQVAASFQLVHTLLEHGLVDGLRLKVFPIVLGDGARLFGHSARTTTMRLVDARSMGGVAVLTCERDAAT